MSKSRQGKSDDPVIKIQNPEAETPKRAPYEDLESAATFKVKKQRTSSRKKLFDPLFASGITRDQDASFSGSPELYIPPSFDPLFASGITRDQDASFSGSPELYIPPSRSSSRAPSRSSSLTPPPSPRSDEEHSPDPLPLAFKTTAFIARPKDAKICSELGKTMIKVGGSPPFNFKHDANHPNTLYIIDPDINMANSVADCYGSDMIVKIEGLKISMVSKDRTELFNYSTKGLDDEKLKKLFQNICSKTIELSINDGSPNVARLQNVNYPANCTKKEGEEYRSEIEKSLSDNRALRSENISLEFGGLFDPGQKAELFILGGAGPGASSKFFSDTVEGFLEKKLPVPKITHLSLNGCPGKAKYISGDGPSFLKHYENAMAFFRNFAKEVVVPCNTNHIVMDCNGTGDGPGWLAESNGKIGVLDYRDVLAATFKQRGVKQALILGTTSTTASGLYSKCLETLLRTDGPGEKKIMDAIYAIKEGKLDNGRKLIDGVIKTERKKHGSDLTVALACTELPLSYSPKELRDKNLICVSKSAIDFFIKNSKDLNAAPSFAPETPISQALEPKSSSNMKGRS